MAVALGAFGLLMVTGHPAPASETRTVPVTIKTGESYVIQDVSKDSTPGVKVVSNPSALIVHTDAPGKVVLLGAAAGNWDIDVTLASGEKVTYAVDVKPVASPMQPPASTTNPPAGSDPSPASASAAPAGAAVAPPAPTVEPVKVASADPPGPVAADPPAPAHAALPPAAAPPTVVADASTPAYSSAAAVTSTAPVVAPSSPNGGTRL